MMAVTGPLIKPETRCAAADSVVAATEDGAEVCTRGTTVFRRIGAALSPKSSPVNCACARNAKSPPNAHAYKASKPLVMAAADGSSFAAGSITVPASAGGKARHTLADSSMADLTAGPQRCKIRPENCMHTKKRINRTVTISRVRRFASKRSSHAKSMRLKSRFISAEQASASAAHHFKSGRATEIPIPIAMCHRIPASAKGSANPYAVLIRKNVENLIGKRKKFRPSKPGFVCEASTGTNCQNMKIPHNIMER